MSRRCVPLKKNMTQKHHYTTALPDDIWMLIIDMSMRRRFLLCGHLDPCREPISYDPPECKPYEEWEEVSHGVTDIDENLHEVYIPITYWQLTGFNFEAWKKDRFDAIFG